MDAHGRPVAIVTALAVTVVLALGTVTIATAQERIQVTCEAMEQQQTLLLSDIDETKAGLLAQAQENAAYLATVTADQVDDPTVLDAAASAVERANADAKAEATVIDWDEVPVWELPLVTDDMDANRDLLQTLTADAQALTDTRADVEASVHRKAVADARAALTQLVSDMQAVLADSEGQVQDDATRQSLAAAIDAANQLLADESCDDLAKYQEQTDSLNAAKASVDASVKAKKDADEAARKAAEEARARGSASQDASPTDTWAVSYYNAYGTSEAAADGSLTQWADGYFIAHDWSANGQRILSKPAHVVVDGRTYHYVSCRTVSRDSTYTDEMKAWVHANGGIAFQTCYGNAYLITHYEPGY